MGLAERQRLFARLATDAALRARWHADPKGVESEFGLEGGDAFEASAAFRRQINGFARSLIRKRQNVVEALLPLSRGALGASRFSILFQQHASTYAPTGVHRHRDDALAFCSFLQRCRGVDSAAPAWTTDLIRFEAAGLSATEAARRCLVRGFRFHVDTLVRAALEPEVSAPARRPTLVLWYRRRPGSGLRRLVLALPFSFPTRRAAAVAPARQHVP